MPPDYNHIQRLSSSPAIAVRVLIYDLKSRKDCRTVVSFHFPSLVKTQPDLFFSLREFPVFLILSRKFYNRQVT